MSGSGNRRKVDDLGRVVIPSPIRRQLGIEEGAEVEFAVDGDRIVVSKPTETCVFCDGSEHLEAFRGKPVCWSCMAAVRALDRERTGEVVSRFGR